MPIRFLDEPVQQNQPEQTVQSEPLKSPSVQPPLGQGLTYLGSEAGADIAEAEFPRTAEAVRSGKGFIGQTTAAGLDLLSLPGRALASLLGKDDDETFIQSLAQKEGEGFVGDIVRDPATGAAVLTLPLSAAFTTGKLGLSAAAPLTRGVIAGAGEGLLGSTVNQVENVATKGEEFSPGQVALETGVSAAIPVLGKGVGVVANKALGKLTQELSGVSQEALRKFGTGFGKGAKQLKEAANNAIEIGKNLLDAIDNFDQFIPESEIVDNAIKGMGKVSTKNALSVLEQSIPSGKGLLPNEKAARQTLIQFKNAIKQAGSELDASEFKALRQRLDQNIDFSKEGSNIINDALKKTRKEMASDLVKAAEESGNKEYADAMKIWSEKLKAKDKLTRILGKTKETREERVQSFVSNLFGKNKSNRQNILKEIDNILGENFSEQAKLLKLSSELGEGGIAKVFPASFTGRSLLGVGVGSTVGGPQGAILGTALSSPRIGAGVLTLSDLLEQGLEKGAPSLGVLSREASR